MKNFKNIEKERDKFRILDKKTYFLSASTAAIPDYIFYAVKEEQERRFYEGGNSIWNNMNTLEMIDWSKKEIAKMISAKAENITFGDNSSRMLNIFANGISLKKGDNIIISEDSFISNKYIWQLKENVGVNIKYIKTNTGYFDKNSVINLIDEKTKVVSICYCESCNGFKVNLKEIGEVCKEKKIYLCVDAVQAMGNIPIDVNEMNISFLVGNDYKWMFGFGGTGFAYISDNLLNKIEQYSVGWMSDKERFNTSKKRLELRSDASRFEIGLPNTTGIYTMGLAAERYNSLGKLDIDMYIREIKMYLISRLEENRYIKLKYNFGIDFTGGIFYLIPKEKIYELYEFLEKKNILLELSEDSLRISIHYFNNKKDIDILLEAVDEFYSQEEEKNVSY